MESQNIIRNETSVEQGAVFQSVREMVETLAVALLLSILFKFFIAEAYVIPTGSMAPTLMGRHKDVLCPECGFRFQVNASEEMDNEHNIPNGTVVAAGTCPNCGHTQKLLDTPSFKGDRVIVNKCVPSMRPTRRWDVSVFRCPAVPKNNYIKRIVGLPNEDVRIQYGDIFVRAVDPDGTRGEFEIANKPLNYLLSILQTVDDDSCRPARLLAAGWPSRWRDELSRQNPGGGNAGWVEVDGGFYCSGKTVPAPDSPSFEPASMEAFDAEWQKLQERKVVGDDGTLWLRYRHIVTPSEVWNALDQQQPAGAWLENGKIQNNPQLVTDMTAYNTGIPVRDPRSAETYGGLTQHKSVGGLGFNWTGDLAISCQMRFGAFSEGEQITFELVKGGTLFRARILPAESKAILEIPSIPLFTPLEAPITLAPEKKYEMVFLNIDEQLRLVIDGRQVEFPNDGRYDHLCQPLSNGTPGVLPRNRDPNGLDLSPAAIGVKNGAVEVSRLKILRDIYYIAMGEDHQEPIESIFSRGAVEGQLVSMRSNARCDRFFARPLANLSEETLTEFYSDPGRWNGYGNTKSVLFRQGDNAFLALGDNSGLSQDSRLWAENRDDIPHYVDRQLMLGKAVCVFWPHGKPIPGTNLFLIPDFARMRGID